MFEARPVLFSLLIYDSDLSKVPPEPFVVIVPRLDEVEQQRLAAFAKLENEFTAQIKAVHEQAKVRGHISFSNLKLAFF